MSGAAGRRAARLLGGTVLGGAAVLAWSLVEARRPVLRRTSVAVLPPGQAPLRLLHLSDLHLTPRSTGERDWVAGLAALAPDLTVVTGDMLAHQQAVPVVLEALGGLLDGPGAFVLGSNDYLAPRPRNPLRYLSGPSRVAGEVEHLPTGDLVAGLTGAGWTDLTNTRASLDVRGRSVRLVGVDDPHVGRDRMPAPEARGRHGAPAPAADLRLGVTHAPYRRVLDAMADDGSDLVLAGHTHGGQVCLPGVGALVTNCDLPRRYAKGLFAWASSSGPSSSAPSTSAPSSSSAPSTSRPVDGFTGPASSWVHVSAGLGTSPYTPVRLACRPEATLLTLVPRP